MIQKLYILMAECWRHCTATPSQIFYAMTSGFIAALMVMTCMTADAQRDIQSEFVSADYGIINSPSEVVTPYIAPIPEPAPPKRDPPAVTPNVPYQWSQNPNGKKLTGGGKSGFLKACGKVQFGSPCNPRDNAHQVTKEFSDYLMTQMPKCVTKALQAQGYNGSFDKLVIIGDTYAYREIRGGGKMSMHSTGRSLDLTKLKITLTSGKQFDVPMTRSSRNSSSKGKFYKKLISCWQETNRSRCSGKGGLTNRAGALDCTYVGSAGDLHADHAHMSMPFCPRKSGIASN